MIWLVERPLIVFCSVEVGVSPAKSKATETAATTEKLCCGKLFNKAA
jgi:hypothetical protein